MRILLALALLLAFPVLEGWLLFRLGDRFGIWVLVWLVLAAICGAMLIRFEKLVWALRLAGSLREQRSPLRALLVSARSLVAGLLLIFPGVISDILALLLLVWPMAGGRSIRAQGKGGRLDAIEGEYRRESGDRLPPER